MALPFATTCTKCGKTADLRRREIIALSTVKICASDAESTQLGYSYYVSCPHCGLQFESRLQHPK